MDVTCLNSTIHYPWNYIDMHNLRYLHNLFMYIHINCLRWYLLGICVAESLQTVFIFFKHSNADAASVVFYFFIIYCYFSPYMCVCELSHVYYHRGLRNT